MTTPTTLTELIVAAQDAIAKSPLGGETVVHLCEFEREYRPIIGTMLECDDNGAVFLVEVENPEAALDEEERAAYEGGPNETIVPQ